MICNYQTYEISGLRLKMEYFFKNLWRTSSRLKFHYFSDKKIIKILRHKNIALHFFYGTPLKKKKTDNIHDKPDFLPPLGLYSFIFNAILKLRHPINAIAAITT